MGNRLKIFVNILPILGLLVLAGCGCSGGGTEPACKLGEIRDCRCKGGGYGIQECVSSGGELMWGKCTDCIGGTDGGVEEDSGVIDTCSVQGIVGTPCATSADCTGLADPYCLNDDVCLLIKEYIPTCEIPGGYCTMFTQNMTVTLKCGAGAIEFDGTKINPQAKGKACLKCCKSDLDCRVLEGYYCEPKVGGCLPPFVKGLIP